MSHHRDEEHLTQKKVVQCLCNICRTSINSLHNLAIDTLTTWLLLKINIFLPRSRVFYNLNVVHSQRRSSEKWFSYMWCFCQRASLITRVRCHIAQNTAKRWPWIEKSLLLFPRTDAYPSVTNLKRTCPTSIAAITIGLSIKCMHSEPYLCSIAKFRLGECEF